MVSGKGFRVDVILVHRGWIACASRLLLPTIVWTRKYPHMFDSVPFLLGCLQLTHSIPTRTQDIIIDWSGSGTTYIPRVACRRGRRTSSTRLISLGFSDLQSSGP